MNNNKNRRFLIATSSWIKGSVIPENFKTLADHLVLRGHAVVVLVDGKKSDLIKNGPLTVRTWPSKQPNGIRDFLFIWHLIQSTKPHCIICNFRPGTMALVVAWMLRVKTRIMFHHSSISAWLEQEGGLSVRAELLLLRRRFFFSLASKIWTVSKSLQSEVIEYFHVNPEKTSVVYNCLPDPISNNKDFPDAFENKKNRIICIGRLIRMKGQDVLLRAFRVVLRKYPDAQLVLIGDGECRDFFVDLAKELDVYPNCTFLGATLHAKVIQELLNSNISVIPTLQEAFGLVVLESMAVGIPVIASSVGGIPELISDGKEGFLIPPNNPDLLAEKIIVLLGDIELQKRMGANGRETYLEKFDRYKIISEEIRILEQLTD